MADKLDRHLTANGLPPTKDWLSTFTSSSRLNTPLPALQKSAEYRILASDITKCLDKTRVSFLRSNATDASVKEHLSTEAITFQLLDIEDIGRQRWAQIELIEQHERGETTKGREIIRHVRDSEDRGPQVVEESRGPHKLLLQDAQGTKVYAMEMTPVPGIGLGMSIGAKMIVKKAITARGLLLLEPANVQVLGGKVVAWAEQWQKDRKQMLKSRLNMPSEQAD